MLTPFSDIRVHPTVNPLTKNILVFFLLIAFSSIAQDTLIWKNKSRTVVSISDMYEDLVFYKKISDSTSRKCHLSDLHAIYYADGSKRHLEHLYSDPHEDSLITSTQIDAHSDIDMNLYNQGIKDALEHYNFKNYWNEKRSRSPNEQVAPLGVLSFFQFTPFSELDVEYPNKELASKSDYRAGYLYAYKLKKTRHQRVALTILVVSLSIIAITVF